MVEEEAGLLETSHETGAAGTVGAGASGLRPGGSTIQLPNCGKYSQSLRFTDVQGTLSTCRAAGALGEMMCAVCLAWAQCCR